MVFLQAQANVLCIEPECKYASYGWRTDVRDGGHNNVSNGGLSWGSICAAVEGVVVAAFRFIIILQGMLVCCGYFTQF